MDPRSFMAGAIRAHEGGLSMVAADNGNWFNRARYKAGLGQARGSGVLVGSKFGVTAYALARYRGHDDVQPWEMESLTFDEAVEIAIQLYVKAPRFDLMPDGRDVLSLIDKGWGSGPGQATKLWQRMVAVNNVEGKIGPTTTAATAAFRKAHGEEGTARAWAAVRHAFDRAIATNQGPRDPDLVFLKGWDNRTDSFLPGTPWWRAAS